MSKPKKTEEEKKAEADAKAAKKAEADAAKAAKKAEANDGEYQFNPKKLMGVGHGVWKYSDDTELVTRETFHQSKAKDYGIKKDDVVFVSYNGVVEIIGV